VADSRAQQIIDQQQKLRSARSNWDNLYQEVADRVWPQMADFVVKRTAGEKRSEKIFDSTAPLALDRASAAFYSLMVPDTGFWHGLSLGKDSGLMENVAVKAWLDEIRKVLFSLRRSPRANFASQAQECIRSLIGFGTLAMFTEDVPGRGIRYKSIHLAELDFTENKDGQIDTNYRRFEYTARQAVEAFGLKKLPPKVKECYEKKDENSKFEFIHYVAPDAEYNPTRRYAKQKFKSCYVSVEGKGVVEEGGYRRFPYHISRYATNPRETRGRGPAIVLLPDIKMLNEQEKTRLRAGHLAVDPPLLLFEDGALQGFQMRPRALNYGGVNEQGNQMVIPLQTGANLPWATELLEERRKLINEGFWLTLFQILVENPKMTATEAMLRAQEKGQLLAPPVRRQETEWLGPQIRREIDIATEMDLIPMPPPEVLEMLPIEYDPENGFGEIDLAEVLDIEYTNPLARMMRSEDAVSILRTFEQLAPMAEIDPSVYDEFHPQRVAAELAEINGVPSKVRRTEKEKRELAASKQQASQMAQTLEAAPVAASAAKDMAQAAAMAGNAPGPIRELAPA
jgi:hypothetical protein